MLLTVRQLPRLHAMSELLTTTVALFLFSLYNEVRLRRALLITLGYVVLPDQER